MRVGASTTVLAPEGESGLRLSRLVICESGRIYVKPAEGSSELLVMSGERTSQESEVELVIL